MDFTTLERRRHPRTRAFVPIAMRYDGRDALTPGQMLDLSQAGAAVMTTDANAPELGQFVELRFEPITNDGASEGRRRRERGLVVNLAAAERGITRIGIRFLRHLDLPCGLLDPDDLLSNYRKSPFVKTRSSRWDAVPGFRPANTFRNGQHAGIR